MKLNKHYAFVLIILGYLAFIPIKEVISALTINSNSLADCINLPIEEANRYLHSFQSKETLTATPPASMTSDTNFVFDGLVYWGKDTDVLRNRIGELRSESPLFNKILSEISQSDYPFYVKSMSLKNALGEYSSLQGELRFYPEKMQEYLFDATLIEEFVHAYQSVYYGYNHGQCRKKDYLFAQLNGDATYKKRLELSFLSWERYGSKHAYIESEAKAIVFLIQNQAASVPFLDILHSDEYNAGGAARSVLLPYLNKRNCSKYKRTEKMTALEDLYVDLETFMRYQNAFVRYWKKVAPGSPYQSGRFRHRPEALQALSK